MPETFDLFPSPQAVGAYVALPETLRQLAALAVGAALAWLIGTYLRKRLQPVVAPGVIEAEMKRTAVRSGVLALVPIMLWLWLLATTAVFRRLGMPLEILRPAMLLVGALALIRIGVFVLRHSAAPGSRLKAYEGALTVTIWLLVAVQILGWQPHIEQILDEYAVMVGKVRVSVYTVVSLLLSSAVLLVIALGLSNALAWRVKKSQMLDESLKIAINKLGKFVLLTFAVVVAMITAGIDLTALAVFGGALGVGLGLGLQRIVSNFVSGIILAFEGSIRLGDTISVGGAIGTVRALHARHVVVHTRDGLDLLVPNESLLTTEITNWSYDDRHVRLHLPVQISYADDPEAVIALLEGIARANPDVLAAPAPSAVVTAFAESGIDLELLVWVGDPEHGLDVRSALNREIWKAFRAEGITIPFPQREVRLTDHTGARTTVRK
jgi:small-conductance mechanosensitive channel